MRSILFVLLLALATTENVLEYTPEALKLKALSFPSLDSTNVVQSNASTSPQIHSHEEQLKQFNFKLDLTTPALKRMPTLAAADEYIKLLAKRAQLDAAPFGKMISKINNKQEMFLGYEDLWMGRTKYNATNLENFSPKGRQKNISQSGGLIPPIVTHSSIENLEEPLILYHCSDGGNELFTSMEMDSMLWTSTNPYWGYHSCPNRVEITIPKEHNRNFLAILPIDGYMTEHHATVVLMPPFKFKRILDEDKSFTIPRSKLEYNHLSHTKYEDGNVKIFKIQLEDAGNDITSSSNSTGATQSLREKWMTVARAVADDQHQIGQNSSSANAPTYYNQIQSYDIERSVICAKALDLGIDIDMTTPSDVERVLQLQPKTNTLQNSGTEEKVESIKNKLETINKLTSGIQEDLNIYNRTHHPEDRSNLLNKEKLVESTWNDLINIFQNSLNEAEKTSFLASSREDIDIIFLLRKRYLYKVEELYFGIQELYNNE